MFSAPLDVIPLWILFLAACLVGWLSLETGYRFGSWRHAHVAEEKESPVGAIVGSILALLAFMLGFTFSLAASRFDARRYVVLDEANAIGTTYLRARLLPEPEQSEIAKLLREYVDVRVHGIEEGAIQDAVKRSEELQEKLWSAAMSAADKQPTVMTSLFLQALNDVIDVHAKRLLVGARSRVPMVIWIALIVLATLGLTFSGYQAGLSATRRSPAMFALVLAFAGVFYLIGDLDRGAEGFLTVNQEAMTDLQKSMKISPP